MSLLELLKNKIDNTFGETKTHLQQVMTFITSRAYETETLKSGQISKICQVAPRTVNNWIDKGRIIGYRLVDSKDRRVLVRDLRSFMIENDMPVERLDSFLAKR